MKKTFFLLLTVLFLALPAHADFFRLGLKYGYAYIDDFDRGKTYGALLEFPLGYTFDFEAEYGKFEDGDGLIEGKYGGVYIGAILSHIFRVPFKAKAGFVKQDLEFDEIKELSSDDFKEENFSWGIGTGINTPYFSGYLEYLQISDEIYTLAATFRF